MHRFQFHIKMKILLLSIFLFFAVSLLQCTAVHAYTADDNLTLDYFLQNPNHTLIYWYNDNGNSTEFSVNWEPISWNKYKKTCNYPDGLQDFSYYLAKDGTIVETNSGWSIPESEWTDYPVIRGSNVVFRTAVSNTTWTNEYVTLDGWGNMQKEYNIFTYLGLEKVEIQGRLIPAAKLAWSSESIPIFEAPETEWEVSPGSSRGNDWYAKGLGLVKRNFLNNNGNVTSSFTLTNICDSRRFKFVPIEEWQPVAMVILGEFQGGETTAAIYDGSILVPVRYTLEYFNQDFTWDQKRSVLTVATTKGPVTLAPGNSFCENAKDGSILILPAPAQIIGGKLMAPAEFINEVLGLEFRWDKKQNILELFPHGSSPVYAK